VRSPAADRRSVRQQQLPSIWPGQVKSRQIITGAQAGQQTQSSLNSWRGQAIDPVSPLKEL